jgi:hypothetical protein
MLQQPTKEKLHALRLHGMIEAIERQEQDEEARGLSFLDRPALLIEGHWVVPRSEPGTSRWQLAAALKASESDRRAGYR